ncbi:hypothetical protein [uncultured Albimonas sp.]|jgi:hypothetical protein|uniref:hypothetical protein n=1 Tax=uncultured Albimonas sp. TaxID=1331701 RepID=UPI0030ED56CF|tara:strand:+ start:1934 stop:2902 length:969 start_codon:yes stop_codon:yes gene_type:complete
MKTPNMLAAGACVLSLAGCEVDPLETKVANPSHRAALAAGAGVVAPGARVDQGELVEIHLTDGGYLGSGPATDMNSFRAVTWSLCEAKSCAPMPGAEAAVTSCRRVSGGATACEDRPDGEALLGQASFYDDQRVSIEATGSGRFMSGVWHQTPEQRRNAERLYASMMTAFEGRLTEVYTEVADARRAPLDIFQAIGEAGYAGTEPAAAAPAPSPAQGGLAQGDASDAMASRSVSVQQGYNIGDHPYEVQSREVAARYDCESAQAIPHVTGASCESFRALVIIEACRAQIPPEAYNKDQPEFLRVVDAFANPGSDLSNGVCGF